jgi:hypothetical protein
VLGRDAEPDLYYVEDDVRRMALYFRIVHEQAVDDVATLTGSNLRPEQLLALAT